MEKNFPAIRDAQLGSKGSLDSSMWILEDHLLGFVNRDSHT